MGGLFRAVHFRHEDDCDGKVIQKKGVHTMIAYLFSLILPFLAAGLLAGTVFSCSRKHSRAHRQAGTVCIVLLLAMSMLTAGGTLPCGSGLSASAEESPTGETAPEEATAEAAEAKETEDAAAEDIPPLPDFTLLDQYGAEHKLSNYRGKTVVLNFWATWCPWCITEMPDFEALYHELGENGDQVVILGMAAPGTVDPDADSAKITAFLEEHGITYPVLMDMTGEKFSYYGASSLPTSWFIDGEGRPIGYLPGALTKENLLQILREAAGLEL